MNLKPWKSIQFSVMLTLLAGMVLCIGCQVDPGPTSQSVRPVSDELRAEFGLAPFYQKSVMLGSFPVVGSAQVSDAALLEAGWIVEKMLGDRTDILDAMADQNVRLVVMAWNEFTTDVPEHAHLEPAVYWDRRARGLGSTAEAPAVSCAEENLLAYPGDPYEQENILIHEFAHAMHEMGLNRVDPTFELRLREAWEEAKDQGLWRGTYAITNPAEYWAEAVQSWFDDNRENDALHNRVNTRVELQEYDPALAALCSEVFGDRDWRYRKPQERGPGGQAHLASHRSHGRPPLQVEGVSPDRPAPSADRHRPRQHHGRTRRGSCTRDDRELPPIRPRRLLFGRRVFPHRDRGQPAGRRGQDRGCPGRCRVPREDETYEPIALEKTSETGLRHLDGTISMARSGPDTATHSFFICVGDQPELDFGGKRNPDGQGFAAFGRVVEGMELVREIQEMPADGQSLDPPLSIQRAVRVH